MAEKNPLEKNGFESQASSLFSPPLAPKSGEKKNSRISKPSRSAWDQVRIRSEWERGGAKREQGVKKHNSPCNNNPRLGRGEYSPLGHTWYLIPGTWVYARLLVLFFMPSTINTNTRLFFMLSTQNINSTPGTTAVGMIHCC